jgi:hypothetical protein
VICRQIQRMTSGCRRLKSAKSSSNSSNFWRPQDPILREILRSFLNRIIFPLRFFGSFDPNPYYVSWVDPHAMLLIAS